MEERENMLKALKILKLFRVFRLNRIITYMNSTDDVKHSLRLFKLFFIIILIVHFEACGWFYIVANPPSEWIPSQYDDREEGVGFYEAPWST